MDSRNWPTGNIHDEETPLQPACKVPGLPREPILSGDYSFNMGTVKKFTTLDMLLFVVTLIISTGIGFYQAWRSRKRLSIEEFLLAGRSMDALPVALSLFASFKSTISMMGTPTEVYIHSTMTCWMMLSYLIALACAAQIYIPVYYRLRVLSAHEYLEMRFNRTVRTSAACVFLIQMIMYMAIALYAPSLAVYAVTGVSLWGSILFVGVVSTLYTALGGVKAVIWTDTFQAVMMILGMVLLLACAATTVGSWSMVWDSAVRSNRLIFADFRIDPTVRHSVWALLIGGTCTWLSIYGVNQAQVHRCLTCRTLEKAQTAVWWNVLGLCIFVCLGVLIGLQMSAFYENCDPSKASLVQAHDQITMLFVMDIMGESGGLAGILLASLFCGALSSISSGLNSISAVILEDIIKLHTKIHLKHDRARKISIIVCIITGAVCLELAYAVSKLGDLKQVGLTLVGGLSAPLLGVFTLGIIFPWTNQRGALFGLHGSFIFILWVVAGNQMFKIPSTSEAIRCISNCNMSVLPNASIRSLREPDIIPAETPDVSYLYNMSYLFISALGFIVCVCTGLITSFLTGLRDPKDLDPKLIVPVLDVVFPFYYLPERIRKPFRFGIDHSTKWFVGKETGGNGSQQQSQLVSCKLPWDQHTHKELMMKALSAAQAGESIGTEV